MVRHVLLRNTALPNVQEVALAVIHATTNIQIMVRFAVQTSKTDRLKKTAKRPAAIHVMKVILIMARFAAQTSPMAKWMKTTARRAALRVTRVITNLAMDVFPTFVQMEIPPARIQDQRVKCKHAPAASGEMKQPVLGTIHATAMVKNVAAA